MRDGVLPEHLLEAVANLGEPGWFTSDDDGQPLAPEVKDERAARLGEVQALLIASAIRAWRRDVLAEWVEVSLAPEDVLGIDELDYDRLEDLVMRRYSPEYITASSRATLGFPAEEVPSAEWDDFRGEPGGAAPGADSEPLAPAPERAPARGRRRDRVPAR